MTAAIQLEGVTKVFEGPDAAKVTAVDAVDLEIARGETVCLIGPSGCGKTTLLRTINRLCEPDAGTVRVDGKDVRSIDPIALRRGIGYVIQRGGLFPHMTVRRNVGLLLELSGWSKAEMQARVDELLTLVGLQPEQFGSRYPRELSGGQRQRVGVARALAADPPIVLMDEPFGALDPITRAQIQREFTDLEALLDKTLVIVTHDLTEAFLLGDRVAVMNEGKLVQVATPDELREAPVNAMVRSFVSSVAERSSG